MKTKGEDMLEDALKDLRNKIETLLDSDKNIVIWGAGNTALLYAPVFQEEVDPVAFVDNFADKYDGRMFLGTPVILPNELHGKEALILICSQNPPMVDAISHQIEETLKLPFLTINEFILARHAEEIRKCVDLLEDNESRDVYCEVVSGWVENRFPDIKYYSSDVYFGNPQFVTENSQEIYVDLGAFVGDTIEKFMFSCSGTFKKIIAFEPDRRNFSAMKERAKRLRLEWALEDSKIELVNAGVGRRTCQMHIEETDNGLSSKICTDESYGDAICQVYALDDYFKEQKITFLKADIESSEYDMLLGAEKTLQRDRPKLAICIYHNPLDLFRIMLWLNSLNIGYKFSIRHHAANFTETVLYAQV